MSSDKSFWAVLSSIYLKVLKKFVETNRIKQARRVLKSKPRIYKTALLSCSHSFDRFLGRQNS